MPDALELVNNSPDYGDTYTVNGTTYYKRGAQLTLKLKDGYTAAAIMNGGDTLDLAADDTYSTTVSGVTTITVSGISGRDPTMETKNFTLSGLTSSDISITATQTEGGGSWTLKVNEDEIDWLTYDDNEFTLKKVPENTTDWEFYTPFTIKENNATTASTLKIDDNALYGRDATWTLSGNKLTTTNNNKAGFFYFYGDSDLSSPQICYASEFESEIEIIGLPTSGLQYGTDIKVVGYSIVLSQNAVNAIIASDGTVSNSMDYSFVFDKDVTIEKETSLQKEWSTSTNGNTTTLNVCSQKKIV